MIVVDASVAVFGLLNDGISRSQLSVEVLAAPHLVDTEVAHALGSRVLRGELAAEDAERALSRWARLGIDRFPVTGLLDRVWQLRDNLSSYDASYVAVAEALGCSLVTADRRLAGATGPTCPITVVAS
ncbi:MAG: type II toxin-antitoxin system VapC family toxin [Acidimicrobiia bacterium]|nr:type II toxin-antitoxin system VapC family toxin [Acidimicrobiia bacterium]